MVWYMYGYAFNIVVVTVGDVLDSTHSCTRDTTTIATTTKYTVSAQPDNTNQFIRVLPVGFPNSFFLDLSFRDVPWLRGILGLVPVL